MNWFHIAILIYMIELDVSMFSMPRLVAENIGTNGWIGVMLLSLVAAFNIWLIQLVYRASRGRSAFEIVERSVPRFLWIPVYLLLAFLWIALGGLIVKKYVLIFQMLSFPTTNPLLLYGVIVLLMFYLLSKGIYNIGKASTIFFIFTIVLIFFIFYFFSDWRAIRFTNFIFQGTTAGNPVFKWLQVFPIFIGYELALLLFPFASKQSKLMKGVYIGHFFHTFTILLMIATCFGFFSFEQLKSLMYPVINLLSYIELPFINRVENLIYTIFLFANLISIVLYAWAALLCLRRIFPGVRSRLLELVLTVLLFGFGFIPLISREADEWLNTVFYSEITLSFAAPLVLLVLLAWQNRFRKEELT
ncbi:GerAB/ArcD/ProY family transporter [Paenibacillus nasutitermitis]|uniref:GerAB/ArcD/ProY family transporter n=1 Tax=Paenibacillus nasutitermitis TaxID=1652958 RepID=UPI0016659082|nr:GerAB/ArcD/ProY family transporter [Paenibacillus nasutitermitis]